MNSHRRFVSSSILVALALFMPERRHSLAIAADSGEAMTPAGRPNFVFILIDDLGWADVGCYGSRFYQTPHIDRLASRGMRFTDAYAAGPVCSPTRLSIMTGKYPARVRLTNYLTGRRWPDNSPLKPLQNWQTFMPLEEVTIAEALCGTGYISACIGKWHLEPRIQGNVKKSANSLETADLGPGAQGFDVVVSRGPSQLDKGVEAFTDKAVEFLREHKDRPFYLYLSHHSVHIPLEARPELIEKYRAKVRPNDPQNNPTYAGMIECVDSSVGRVVATLEELGLTDNTVVVFTSDNGGLSVKEGPNTPATSNSPLRAGKGFLYEGGIRVPLIVCWPGKIQPGSTCNVPVLSTDFFPTFLEIAGLAKQPGLAIDGESLVPLLTQSGSLTREALYWHYPHYSNQGGLPCGAVRVGDYKLIEFYEDDRVELYNLSGDLGEQHDIAAAMPEKAADLRRRLHDWLTSLDAQIPPKNPDYDPSKPRYSDPSRAPQSWQVEATSR